MSVVTLALAGVPALAAAAAMAWDAPWGAAFFLMVAVLALLARRARSTASRAILVNVAAVLLALAAFETHLGRQAQAGDGTRLEGSITEGFTTADDTLGYRPREGARVTARKLHGGELIYDVAYTIGADGLRVTPPARTTPAAHCAVFLGDSITFGEGVNDEEAYPYRVATASGDELATFNFAFSGYGPHQMLAALQAGRLDRVASCGSIQFVHLAILEHIPRVAGLTGWDRHGPRFRLTAEGSLVRDGNFDDPVVLAGRWTVPAPVVDAFDRFLTWQRLFGRSRAPRDADLTLYLAVMRTAIGSALERYPGSRFDVLLWDGRDDDRLEVIERALTSQGIRVHRLTTAIPDFAVNAGAYLLSPHDGHPNARMHRLLADYIATRVIPPHP